jgi:hypothetical protein
MEQTELAESLRARGHSVILSNYTELSLPSSSGLNSGAEIAVFDVTHPARERVAFVRQFCLHNSLGVCAWLVLCYSRVYHGPKFELSIERLGARFVYAG